MSLLQDAREIHDDLVVFRREMHREPEIGLDLPALQAIVEHQHAWARHIDGERRRRRAIGADEGRRGLRQQQRLVPDLGPSMPCNA